MRSSLPTPMPFGLPHPHYRLADSYLCCSGLQAGWRFLVIFFHGQRRKGRALVFGLEGRSEYTQQSHRSKCSSVVYVELPYSINAAHVACREQQALTHPHLVLRWRLPFLSQTCPAGAVLSCTVTGTLSQELQGQSWESGKLSWAPSSTTH